jgi:hypothetical protein
MVQHVDKIDFNDPPDQASIWRASRVAATVDEFDSDSGAFTYMYYFCGIDADDLSHQTIIIDLESGE